MADAYNCKDHSDHIEIDVKKALPRNSSDYASNDSIQNQRARRLFRPLSQKDRNTWVISLFVLVHIVVFSATMFVNDCWRNSYGDCVLKPFGRLSFQPLPENPLLGPSASTLDEMGAIRQKFLMEYHQTWRLFTSMWLHAGAIHIFINLFSLIFIGIHLEQEFGSLRIGLIYGVSAFFGSLLAALFAQNSPAVVSSGGLFGLLGAMLSGLLRSWNYYTDKLVALLVLFFVAMINLIIGLLPYIDNFANIGGFVSGFLLGFVVLFNPQLLQEPPNKGGLFNYVVQSSANLKQKLDKPALRIVSFSLFGLLFAGGVVAVLHDIHLGKYCSWCQYINCVPSKRWICNDKGVPCETMASFSQLTLTCMGNGNYRVLPYTNVSEARIRDLCSLICL